MSISLHVLMCHYNRSLHTVADGLPSTHRSSVHPPIVRPSVRPSIVRPSVLLLYTMTLNTVAAAQPAHRSSELHPSRVHSRLQLLRAFSVPAPAPLLPLERVYLQASFPLMCVCVFAHLMSSLHQGSLLSKPRCRPFPDASPLSDCVVCPRRSRRRAVSSGSIPPSSLPPSLPAALLCSAAISPGFRPSKPPSAFCWAAPGSDLS